MAIRLKACLVFLVGVVLLAVGAAWYAMHDPDRYIPSIAAYLQRDTGLQVRIQHLQIQLFPTLQVQIQGLEIKNPQPFPSGNFLSVPRLDATIEKLPLLHGQIAIRSLFLHKPTIDFISDPDGLWNFQNPSGSKKAPAHFSILLIPNMQIENGILLGSNLIDPNDKPGPVVLEIGNFSALLNATSPKPSDGSDNSTGLAGHLAADTVRFGSINMKDLQSQLRITSRQLVFSNVQIKTYHGRASGDFLLNFGGKNTVFKTDLQADGIGISYLLAEFQNGTSAITGAMQTKLSLAGEIKHTSSPFAGIHGTAQITIRKGELPKLNQNQSMLALERFRPASAVALPASAFTMFTADMELRNNHIYSKRIDVNFYGTDVVGSGNTSLLDGALDYRGAANVVKKQGLLTSLFARMFKEAHQKDGRLTFPLRLTGTLTTPSLSVAE
jgi:uncharacterized protein involved in outer membrane biogenesis